jgi:large subunit ribosomal protein L3
MGAASVTVQNLEVVKVDAPNNLLLIKGAVPGHKNAYVLVRRAKKKKPTAAEKKKVQAKPAAKKAAPARKK